jgi:hypothetical protein
VHGLEWLALQGADGDHLNNSAGAMPVGFDVLSLFLGAQGPSDVVAVAALVIRCYDRGPALSVELALVLAVVRLLVGFNRQQKVGPPGPIRSLSQ